MKKTTIKYIAALALGLPVFSACQHEFLEVDPRATQIESNYYKNPAEVFNGLVAAYDPLSWEGDAAAGYANFACLVAASDEAYGGGGSSSDVWYLQTMNNFNLLDPANGPQMGFWYRNFAGVSRVNTILAKLGADISGLDQATKARYTAEERALVYRPHLYR
jgi:hypothetical protein